MRAHEVSFLDLVQGEKQFQVPLYQRTYSWRSKQLAQLWRDLELLLALDMIEKAHLMRAHTSPTLTRSSEHPSSRAGSSGRC